MIRESSIYGSEELIKDYAQYPSFLPLPVHYEHGWTPLSEPLKSDFRTKKPTMLVFSERRKKAWVEKGTSKNVVVSSSPMILYKIKHQIEKSKSAQGTIVFPAHSTLNITAEYNFSDFCEKLSSLPDKYQPVVICLHWQDMKKGIDEKYKKKGFKVVTAGDMYNKEFSKNFYEILRSYSYSASNEIGSYTFYSINLNIPFFLIDENVKRVNNGEDPNVVVGEFSLDNFDIVSKAKKLFKEKQYFVTKDQKDFVNEELGIEKIPNPQELKHILYVNLLKNIFSKNLIWYLLKIVSFRRS